MIDLISSFTDTLTCSTHYSTVDMYWMCQDCQKLALFNYLECWYCLAGKNCVQTRELNIKFSYRSSHCHCLIFPTKRLCKLIEIIYTFTNCLSNISYQKKDVWRLNFCRWYPNNSKLLDNRYNNINSTALSVFVISNQFLCIVLLWFLINFLCILCFSDNFFFTLWKKQQTSCIKNDLQKKKQCV